VTEYSAWESWCCAQNSVAFTKNDGNFFVFVIFNLSPNYLVYRRFLTDPAKTGLPGCRSAP
jgi:hypothetical protein